LLHGYCSLVYSGEVAAGGRNLVADFHGHVGDKHAMFSPEILDLPLAAIDKVIQILDKEDPFARCDGSAAAA